jgi:hypothetical protein
MSKHTLTTLSKPALSEAEQKQMGAQITAQYLKTEVAQLEIITLGAMLAQIEALDVGGTLCHQPQGGRYLKGSGLKPWLAKYAPDVDYTKARRYRDIAQELVRKFSLKSAERLELIATTDEKELKDLDPALRKKRAKVVNFVSEKSVRAMQLELGLIGGGSDDDDEEESATGTTTKKKASAAERHAAAIAAARERALQAFASLHILGPRWKLLDDKLLRQALHDTEALAKELHAWLAVPAHDRAAFDLPAYLATLEKKSKADQAA